MTGTIEINRLKIYAYHGILPQERVCGNFFEVDVRLRYPLIRAAQSDNVSGTVNYAQAIEIIQAETSHPAALIEHAAWRIWRALMRKWPAIEGGMVRVAKLTPPLSAELDSVAVKIEF